MFGSDLLEIAMGMVFVYLLLSLIASGINEGIEARLKNRATDLERGIQELLGDKSLVEKLYKHPLINGLYKGKYEEFSKRWRGFFLGRWLQRLLSGWPKLPSYIPSRDFALALMDVVSQGSGDRKSGAAGATPPTPAAAPTVVVNAAPPVQLPPVQPQAPPAQGAQPQALPAQGAQLKGVADQGAQQFRQAISKLADLLADQGKQASQANKADQAMRALLTLVDAAGQDPKKVRENIENWFNSSMDRVSGWYKRRAQLFLLIIGLTVAVALDADSITLFRNLSTDKSMRQSLIAAAETYASQNQSLPDAKDAIASNLKQIKSLSLPLGWLTGEEFDAEKEVAEAGKAGKSNEGLRRRQWPGLNWSGENGWKNQIAWHWLGWLLTALAISLGAPFWFDLLNKFILLRASAKPPDKSSDSTAPKPS